MKKKMMVLLKRKPGLTFEEFKHHYETVHTAIGEKYFDGLLVDFARHYPTEVAQFPGDWTNLDFEADVEAFDCMTFYSFRDGAAYEEFVRLMADPEISAIQRADEEKFLDRPKCRYGFCDVSEGTGIIPKE